VQIASIGADVNKKYVAVPTKVLRKPIVIVEHDGKRMMINKKVKPLGYISFPDKFGRDKHYTLAYFEWKG